MSRDAFRDAASMCGGRTYVKVLGPRAEPELSPFPCALLCMECRYLAPPAPAGDPMRTDGDARSLDPCPRCGDMAWADLRNVDMRHAVGELDAAVEDGRRTSWSTVLLCALTLAATVGAVWLLASGTSRPSTIAAACFVPMLLAPTWLAVWSRRVGKTKRRRTPVRWHRPFAERPARKSRAARGPAVASEPLVSPLTGRRCVAYEVGVRLDDDADGRDATWELIEQRNAALTIGGVEIEPDAAWISGPRIHVYPDPAAVEAYLVQRGLDPVRTRYTLFETVIEPHATCRVSSSGRLLEAAA